jgi:iron complex transport system permease protein
MSEVLKEYLAYRKKKAFLLGGVLLFLSVAAAVALQIGSSGFTLREAFRDEAARFILWNIRTPRVLGAIFAGGGLAIAGAVMQGLLRNPLADPFTLGVSHGAALGAAIAILLFGAGTTHSSAADAVVVNNPYLVVVFAFLFAMLTSLAILALSVLGGISAEGIVLAGVALGSVLTAATVMLQYFASDVQIAAIVFWTFGDLGRISGRELLIILTVFLVCFSYFYLKRWDYNTAALGDEAAKGLGVNINRARLAGMFFSSLLTASVVAFLGIIGFMGIISPHIVRRLVGGDNRFVLPGSVLVGGLLLLLADTFGRTVIAPVVLPVGAVTSFLGAPMFLYLLLKTRR